MTGAIQTVLDVLRSGIDAAMSIFGGVQSYSEAGNQVAAGTGSFAEAFKTIYNVVAGFCGFPTLDPPSEGPDQVIEVHIVND